MAFSVNEKPKYKKQSYAKKYFPPKIERVYTDKDNIRQYEKFELNIVLDKKNIYENPDNPLEIDLSATFVSPGGKRFNIPGFIYQGFSLSGTKRLEKYHKPVWKVRFAPNQKGRWRYKIKVKNPQGKDRSEIFFFNCVSSDNPGFIRVSKSNNRYFQFDSGKLFYAQGENLAWIVPDDPFTFKDYLNKLVKTYQNWTRIWNCPWHIIVEWSQPRADGLGKFSQRDSWEFDQMIELARQKGIYMQMVFNFWEMFIPGDKYNRVTEWQNNPYNKKLGGPCKNPKDFFTSRKAREFFKRKLRYFIARWGYSTNILAWELFNEVDLVHNINLEDAANWHKEMTHYLKQNDPFSHLITTSFCRPTAGGKVWRLKEIGFTQVHNYINDVVSLIASLSKFYQKYKKPCLVGEIAGEITNMEEEARDKKGIRLHNSLWTSVMSPLAGTAMYWWWDGHIRLNNLYYHYKALGEFTKDIQWDKLKLIPVNAEIDVKDEDRGDVAISPVLDWEPSTGSKFSIGSNGLIKSDGILSKYFRGVGTPEGRVTPVFDVNYREDGIFSIYVYQVYYLGARLKIIVDGKLVLQDRFPPAKENSTIDKEYRVEIPAGRHVIKVVNDGEDWINVSWIKFCSKSAPRIRVIGMQNRKFTIIWCRNRQSTTENYLEKFKLKPVKGAKIKILGLDKGSYEVEYWDTYKGKISKKEKLKTERGKLELNLPTIINDIACKICKVRRKKK